MGGMLALEWVFLGEHYIKSFISIAAASQQGAWAISWNEVERAIVRADPKFNGGYYPSSDPPKEGLSAASPGSYEARFGRTIVTKSHHELIDSAAATLTQASAEKVNLTPTADSPFLVQSYLQHKAQEFCRLFNANCYISLTQKLDSHDITRGRIYKSIECPVAETLRCLNQPALVVGISLDILYLWTEQERMAKNLKNAQKKLIISGEGHDAFLIHTQDLNRMIADFIRSFERGDISTGARRASHERLITGDSGGQWR
jgi:homoserine O-acetyltransferase